MSSLTGSEVENPDPPPPEENDFDRVVIRIGWDGTAPTWQINGANIPSIDQIREQLAALADIKIDAPLVLHPDPNVPLGFVITAYDEAKLAGFPKVSFAVNAQGK
jgi:biopolymer transport protein ExbD